MSHLNLKLIRKKNPKLALRLKRKMSVRKHISGTSERPRLTVFRSARHIYAQAIDDTSGRTLASASTVVKDFAAEGTKTNHATSVGQAIGKALISQGIDQVVFDRNGFKYHGRVAAVADGAREAGLKF